MRNPRMRRPLTIAGSVVAVVLLCSLLTVAPAVAAPLCGSPPAALPEASIDPGDTGFGLTQVDSGAPVQFDVEIIGIEPDYIAPGLDLVLFQITGPQSYLDAAQGVFSGMSGSPIYLNEDPSKVAGAVSYGFFASDPTIGGFTPAESMFELFNYPAPAASPKPLSLSSRRAIAGAADIPLTDVQQSADRLRIPFAVSGLGRLAQRDRFGKVVRRNMRELGLRRYASGSIRPSGTPADDPTPLDPGERMAAVLSYGDVTWAGIGTATATCSDADVTVGWGHPFFFNGRSSMGMHAATTMRVVSDPSGLFGPWVLASLAESHGTIVQDRLTGVVGIAGDVPAELAPITSSFTNADTAFSRNGETDVAYQGEYWIFDELAWEHMYANFYRVFDQYSDGSASLSWTIDLKGADGTPYTIAGDDTQYDTYDAAYGLHAPLHILDALTYESPERVTFTDVSVSASFTEARLEGQIVRIRTSSSVQPALRVRRTLKARPGSNVAIEVTIHRLDDDTVFTVPFSIHVPHRARGQERVQVRAGRPPHYPRTRGAETLAELVDRLNDRERFEDLTTKAFGATTTVNEDGLMLTGARKFTIKIV